MKRGASAVMTLILLCFLLAVLSGCAKEEAAEPAAKRQTRTTLLIPESPGEETYGNELVTLDTSRKSEGNGLGLSIAKSLTELQNGTMELTVDGDLFKVMLVFPAEES